MTSRMLRIDIVKNMASAPSLNASVTDFVLPLQDCYKTQDNPWQDSRSISLPHAENGMVLS